MVGTLNYEFKNKADYSVTARLVNGTFFKLSHVNNCFYAAQWIAQNVDEWYYINIYARRSNRFICRVYPNQFINPKPR